MKVIASSIRKGNVIEQDGKLYVVLTAENIHPGKGTPVSQIEMRRISDGVKVSERYKTTDQVEKATIEDQNFNYLYKDADGFHFMNNDNYDQVQVPEDIIGSAAPYLQENMTVKLSLHGVIPVAIQMPQRATLEVVETEPVTKGQTASSSYKPAILSNGVRTERAAAYRRRHADRGHDRGRLLRRTRQGLGNIGHALGAVENTGCLPPSVSARRADADIPVCCSSPANPPLRADEFKTPAVSAVHVEWRAALDQLRSEISTQPAMASAFTFSGQRRLPAFDPRSTPALVQLNAVTSQIFTGIGRSPVPVLLPFDTAAFLDARANGVPASLSVSQLSGRFPSRRPVRRRPGRLRRGVFARARRRRRHAATELRQAGRSADHRLDPDLRHQRSRSAARANRSRRWQRNFPTCAASSGRAMCVTPSPASAFPMWCRSNASTACRASGGWPAARLIRSPSVS